MYSNTPSAFAHGFKKLWNIIIWWINLAELAIDEIVEYLYNEFEQYRYYLISNQPLANRIQVVPTLILEVNVMHWLICVIQIVYLLQHDNTFYILCQYIFWEIFFIHIIHHNSLYCLTHHLLDTLISMLIYYIYHFIPPYFYAVSK